MRRPKRLARPEQALQVEIVKLLRLVHAPPTRWTAIERARTKVHGAIQRGMGCNAGWPDLIFILGDGRIAGIELKRPDGKGRVSAEQESWGIAADLEDRPHAVCNSVGQVFSHLQKWGFEWAYGVHVMSEPSST